MATAIVDGLHPVYQSSGRVVNGGRSCRGVVQVLKKPPTKLLDFEPVTSLVQFEASRNQGMPKVALTLASRAIIIAGIYPRPKQPKEGEDPWIIPINADRLYLVLLSVVLISLLGCIRCCIGLVCIASVVPRTVPVVRLFVSCPCFGRSLGSGI